MTPKKFRKKLIKLLNKKKVYSCFSKELVNFVDRVDDVCNEVGSDKVICDLTFLIDGVANVEGDIQDIYLEMKGTRKSNPYNYYDFFNDNGMFDKDFKAKQFLKKIDVYVKDR